MRFVSCDSLPALCSCIVEDQPCIGSAAEPTDEPTAEGSAIAIGGKRSTVTIAKKLKVLDFYESMSGGVCARGAVALAKFPETLRCKGQLARWRQAS